MKEQLEQLRKELDELKDTPMFLKPARAEQAVRKSFELVSELAQTVEHLRFKVEALESLEQKMDSAAIDAETLGNGEA